MPLQTGGFLLDAIARMVKTQIYSASVMKKKKFVKSRKSFGIKKTSEKQFEILTSTHKSFLANDFRGKLTQSQKLLSQRSLL